MVTQVASSCSYCVKLLWRALRFTMTLSFISVPPCLQTSRRLEQDRDICPNVQIQHIHRGWAHTCLAGEGRHVPCLRNQAEANGQMNQRCWGWKTCWKAESRETSGCICCTYLFRSPGLEVNGGASAQTCSLPVIALHSSYWPWSSFRIIPKTRKRPYRQTAWLQRTRTLAVGDILITSITSSGSRDTAWIMISVLFQHVWMKLQFVSLWITFIFVLHPTFWPQAKVLHGRGRRRSRREWACWSSILYGHRGHAQRCVAGEAQGRSTGHRGAAPRERGAKAGLQRT